MVCWGRCDSKKHWEGCRGETREEMLLWTVGDPLSGRVEKASEHSPGCGKLGEVLSLEKTFKTKVL